jgi:O-antigen/teichoic acid export membrane protein
MRSDPPDSSASQRPPAVDRAFAVLAMPPRPYLVNVALNCVGGAAVAGGSLLLPVLLSRLLSEPDFAIWSVCYPVVMYATTLGIMFNALMVQGIAPTAAARDGVAAQALATTLLCCALAASLAFAMLAWLLGPLVVGWVNAPADATGKFSATWRMLGVASGLAITLTTINGIFSGLQRFEWENTYKVVLNGGLIAGVGMLIWWGGAGSDLAQLDLVAALFVTVLALSLMPTVAAAIRYGVPELLTGGGFNRATLDGLLAKVGGLAAWQVGMILVTGLDLLMTMRFDPKATSGYALALATVGACSGLVGATLGPMVPRLAQMRIRSGDVGVLALFLRYQKRLLVALVLICVVLIQMPTAVWRLMIPAASLSAFLLILPILAVAMVIRSATGLYAASILSAGLQRRIVASPLIEGVVNVAASYFLATKLGAAGVALGTCTGAVVCLVAHSLYNSPRTQLAVGIKPWHLCLPWVAARPTLV